MIRLLSTETCRLAPPRVKEIPDYAILSHRWGPAEQEIQFKQINQESHDNLKDKDGYKKIEQCCNRAKEVGLQYVWVDTCCIDKSSPGELSEALVSMFHWYRDAQVCYAYLADVPVGDDTFAPNSMFRQSAWFQRGWTLQELVAPLQVVFLNNNWEEIGTKSSLQEAVTQITGIPAQVILLNHAGEISVAERMSWAANRSTARVEDQAYSLMGLFNVSMPMLYGEGEKAFERLQREILKVSDDQSLFAWSRDAPSNTTSGLLAKSPNDFKECGGVRESPTNWGFDSVPYSMTNKGLHINMPLLSPPSPNINGDVYMAILSCRRGNSPSPLGVYLKPVLGGSSNTFRRANIHQVEVTSAPLGSFRFTEMYIKDKDTSKFEVAKWMRPQSEYVFLIHRPCPEDLEISYHPDVHWTKRGQTLELKSWYSGHAGVLIFQDTISKRYLATCIGAHNHNVWCDIVDGSGDNFKAIWSKHWSSPGRDGRWKNLDRKKTALTGGGEASVIISKGNSQLGRVWHVNIYLARQYSLVKAGRGCCFTLSDT